MRPNEKPDSGWNRLEDTLLTIKIGETVSVNRLVEETGLARETVERVLQELTRTELFAEKGAGVFARRSLWETRQTDTRSEHPRRPRDQ